VIRPLRRAHLWIWIILSVLLPVIFLAGILSRRPTTPSNPHLLWERYR